MPENPKPEGIQSVEAYAMCDLPVGTVYKHTPDGATYERLDIDYDAEPVYVVEWPEPPPRTYDGVPADDLDRVLRWYAHFAGPSLMTNAVDRITAAIALQREDQS